MLLGYPCLEYTPKEQREILETKRQQLCQKWFVLGKLGHAAMEVIILLSASPYLDHKNFACCRETQEY